MPALTAHSAALLDLQSRHRVKWQWLSETAAVKCATARLQHRAHACPLTHPRSALLCGRLCGALVGGLGIDPQEQEVRCARGTRVPDVSPSSAGTTVRRRYLTSTLLRGGLEPVQEVQLFLNGFRPPTVRLTARAAGASAGRQRAEW